MIFKKKKEPPKEMVAGIKNLSSNRLWEIIQRCAEIADKLQSDIHINNHKMIAQCQKEIQHRWDALEEKDWWWKK